MIAPSPDAQQSPPADPAAPSSHEQRENLPRVAVVQGPAKLPAPTLERVADLDEAILKLSLLLDPVSAQEPQPTTPPGPDLSPVGHDAPTTTCRTDAILVDFVYARSIPTSFPSGFAHTLQNAVHRFPSGTTLAPSESDRIAFARHVCQEIARIDGFKWMYVINSEAICFQRECIWFSLACVSCAP